ncbi:hypothetical protein DYP60_01475 [Sphaerochaeta halotolerans]|uniref:Uncharacterized protein n=1 Tax=Sphaerochaeta halotolerans TaxID=2293840 RepID=A0A372MKL8_9SPIR|nr:hypothetical protein [Sphaerochaeta halotolerans]RFU96264.1 hypothetical protein DYP60_01475 [Sphaerochaeta halotolerans]
MMLLHKCDRCTQEADHHIEKADKKVLHLCWDCYNAYLCERLGLDVAKYAHPKTITVNRQRFKVKMEIYHDGVIYYAYKGKPDALQTISFTAPFEMDGKLAVEELKQRVAKLLIPTTMMEDDFLSPMGVIGVEYDEETYDDLAFVIDGERYDSEEFLDLLLNYRGSNLLYIAEPRLPSLEAQWFGNEEQLLPKTHDDDL